MNETEEVITTIIEAVSLQHVDRSKIGPETSLMKGGLELDSVDILEIVVAIEHRFGFKVANPEVGKKYFQSIGSITELVRAQGRPAS